MIRFFTFLGASWWIIVLSIVLLLLAKSITSLVGKTIKDSEIPILWKILLDSIFALIWVLILVVGIPAVIRYLIGIY